MVFKKIYSSRGHRIKQAKKFFEGINANIILGSSSHNVDVKSKKLNFWILLYIHTKVVIVAKRIFSSAILSAFFQTKRKGIKSKSPSH